MPDSLVYFHLDHLGTPIEMTDRTGNTVWEATYKAWGEVETLSGSLKQPLQSFDEKSSLHYKLDSGGLLLRIDGMVRF